MIWLATQLLAIATAAEPCEVPLTEAALRERVADAWEAIEQEDPAAHLKVRERLMAELPCMNTQLPRRPWADFLVTEALMRQVAADPSWRQPLTLALSLVPRHPRAPSWLVEQIETPNSGSTGRVIHAQAGRLIFIDGRVITGNLPPLEGLHVAQTFIDDRWTTVVLTDADLPKSWLQQEAVPEPVATEGLSSWGAAGIGGGFGGFGQAPRMGQTNLVQEQASSGTVLGLGLHGQQNFSPTLGIFFLFDGAIQNRANGAAYLGLSLFNEPLSLWLGAGVTTTTVGGDVPTTVLLPGYHAGISYRSDGAVPLDVHAGGGWWLNGAQFQARAGATLVRFGRVGLRVGADTRYATFTLVDVDDPRAGVLGHAYRWSGGLNLGVSWGHQQEEE